MDDTCFAYRVKLDYVTNEVKEQCDCLTVKDCASCKFYKRDFQLMQERDIAKIRNRKLGTRTLRTRYSLTVNDHYEGEFDSVLEIDNWLLKSRYAVVDENKLTLEDIYVFNFIKIRKVDI